MQLALLPALALVATLLTAQVSAQSQPILFHDLKTKKLITALDLPLSYNTTTTIGISLNQPPPVPVVVALEPASFQLSPGNQKCTTIFTPSNWNVTQSVTLANSMQDSLVPSTLNAPVKFYVFAHQCTHQLPINTAALWVNRQGINAQCSIKTIPRGSTEGINVMAFGEVPYYFMGQESNYAAYYILRSDSVAIITDLQRCKGVSHGGSACMARLAIVVDGSTIRFDPSKIVPTRSSTPLSMSVSPKNLPAGVSMTEFQTNSRNWELITLQLRTGLSIQIGITGGNQLAIHTLSVRPDLELSQRGVTNGWCGSFDVNLPHNTPVDAFRSGSALYESKQLVRDRSPLRETPQPAGPPLTAFLKSTRVPVELNPFSSIYVQPKMVPFGPGLTVMTATCPPVNKEKYTCREKRSGRMDVGFVQAGLPSYSQSSVVEAESMFAAGSAHDGLDGADSDLAAGEENGADEALFSVEGGSSVSDGFSDAVDQFWDEFAGSDEY